MPSVKTTNPLMAKPEGAVVRMIVTLTFALLHWVGPCHFLAGWAYDRPQERLVGLANNVACKKLAIVFQRHSRFGFFNRESRRLPGKSNSK